MAQARVQAKADTLGLEGDGDELGLIQAVEGSFGIRFGETWSTVGEIYDGLLAHVPTSSTGGLCASSMAFYRLRSELTRIAEVQIRVTPATKLADLTVMPPKRLYAHLARELGISPPTSLAISWRASLGVVGVLLSLFGILWTNGSHAWSNPLWWASILLLPIGLWMVRSEEGAYYALTVGDLARSIANANFSRFASLGADARPATLWNTLCAIVAEEAETEVSRITMSTQLFG